MNGQTGFDFDQSPPASKNIDPSTSDMAEAAITKSGKRGSDCQKVYEFLLEHPSHTSAELAEKMKPGDKDWRYTVARRLADLKNKHGAMAWQAGKRVCNITNNKAVTWEAIEERL
jgi:hypothetical protein